MLMPGAVEEVAVGRTEEEEDEGEDEGEDEDGAEFVAGVAAGG